MHDEQKAFEKVFPHLSNKGVEAVAGIDDETGECIIEGWNLGGRWYFWGDITEAVKQKVEQLKIDMTECGVTEEDYAHVWALIDQVFGVK